MGRQAKTTFTPTTTQLLMGKIATTAVRTVEYDNDQRYTFREFTRVQTSVENAIKDHVECLVEEIVREVEQRLIQSGAYVPCGDKYMRLADSCTIKKMGEIVRGSIRQ